MDRNITNFTNETATLKYLIHVVRIYKFIIKEIVVWLEKLLL